ncbi:energy transducer TonB [Gilvimarinus xylanilyticus]|uniref:Energy transducer TonB n=1 Tax=Gilvimarinus xylanilyticus TaxID=2944139 RepID=A0A9X2I1G5_9GAMM|nr:energy transducer TonB [Gilvimarinus xylanilyticus]MCP8900894.1 energy transducer TonB [Gilvimarinus xylanilyticus]
MDKKHLSASALSAGLLALAVGFLWLSQALNRESAEPPEMLEVQVIQPEPPPPTPKTQQVVEKTDFRIQVEGDGPAVVMNDMEVDVEVDDPDMPEVQIQATQWTDYKIDLDAYNLADLDSQPSLLTPINIRFPPELKSRGIEKVMLKLEVMIDENGNVTLLDIIDNPYHSLVGEIKRFVDRSQFSPPQKDGKKVRARFIWPLEINS